MQGRGGRFIHADSINAHMACDVNEVSAGGKRAPMHWQPGVGFECAHYRIESDGTMTIRCWNRDKIVGIPANAVTVRETVPGTRCKHHV